MEKREGAEAQLGPGQKHWPSFRVQEEKERKMQGK
jgi:hypothetical protein